MIKRNNVMDGRVGMIQSISRESMKERVVVVELTSSSWSSDVGQELAGDRWRWKIPVRSFFGGRFESTLYLLLDSIHYLAGQKVITIGISNKSGAATWSPIFCSYCWNEYKIWRGESLDYGISTGSGAGYWIFQRTVITDSTETSAFGASLVFLEHSNFTSNHTTTTATAVVGACCSQDDNDGWRLSVWLPLE